jgi:hypothetical protein
VGLGGRGRGKFLYERDCLLSDTDYFGGVFIKLYSLDRLWSKDFSSWIELYFYTDLADMSFYPI